MIIKVLGTGCNNCKRLLANTQEAVNNLKVDANVLYITDMMQIANLGLLRTPGLIIDDKIVVSGRVPSIDEIEQIIKNM